MISTQRATGSLFGRDALAHAVVQHLGGRARRRAEAGVAQPREHLARAAARRCRTCARSPSGCRRAGAARGASVPWRGAASRGSPRASSRGGCPTGCTARWRRSRPPRGRAATNSSLVVLVGVGRALALAEAAEGAADGADVGDVDVAVDDERDRLARQLRAQLVGRLAHLLDRLRARLGEQRRQLVGAQRHAVAALARSRPATRSGRIGAGGSVRPEPRRGMKLQYLTLIVSSTPGAIHSGSM